MEVFLIEPYIVDHIEDSYGAIVYRANPALACDDCSDLLSKQPPRHFSIDTTKDQPNENPVAEHQTVNKAERVISAQNAFLVTQALYTAIWGADWSNKPYWQGTGYRAQTLKRRDIAGKTGTTNSSRDAWFSGYSRRLVTTAWIGFDDPSKELGRTSKNNNLTTKQTFAGESGAKSAQPAWIDFMSSALQTLPVEPFNQPENIVSVRIDKSTGKLTDKTDKTTGFEFFILGTTPTDYVTQDNSNEVIEGNENIEDTDIF
jgi:penicillin-binding protein 1A